MRRTAGIVLVLLLATYAFAVAGSEVAYIGGSLSLLKPGDIGAFDLSSATELVFSDDGKKVSIAYNKLKKIEYRKDVAVHLGVAPAVAVGLIKRRERRHFVTLTYTDEAGIQQAAVFEVAKDRPRTLLPILAARAPQACVISDRYQPCPVAPPNRPFMNQPRP